ncbi:MAG TPA: gliding motility-associated C-terminal domain-containing protein, partial [Cyclobacteriaceae bacterium]|nr:gliding motility-associated C-terminal domain-containing protein [Cyclobacteriaceae bacterium]
PLKFVVTNNSTGQTTSNNNQPATFNVQLPSQGPSTTVLYTIQVTDAANCTLTTNNFPITTTGPLPLQIANVQCSPTYTANCAGCGAVSYGWTAVGTATISGAANNSSVLMTPGQATLTVTGTQGTCSTTISQPVSISTPITPAITQSDPCQNQVVLSAAPAGNYTYRWYENIVPPAPPASPPPPTQVGQQIVITATDNGASFILEVVDPQSGCSFPSAAKTVQVVGPITASVSAPLVCDNGKPFTLTSSTGSANPPSPTYVWKLNGTVIANASGPTLQQTSEGTYEVDINQSGCPASATIQIIKAPIPIGSLPPVAVICSDPDNHDPTTKTVLLNPGVFTTYNWFKNEVQLDTTTQTYTAKSPGIYRVDLTNVIGCLNGNTINVINDCEPVVTGPNVFRPNSLYVDNTGMFSNRVFKLFTFFITDNFEVVVYDRWGEAVFESNDKKFQWNGGYKNNPSQPLPGGTYVYLVRYVSSFHPDQGVQEQRGGVVLLR